jgi:hypothetical protein
MTMDPTDRVSRSTPTSVADPLASASSTTTGDAPALLPEPSLGGLGDDAYANLAMLLTRADQDDGKDASKLQQVADRAASQEDDQRVEKMREKADKDEDQGLASGFGDIAGGLAAIGGAAWTGNPEGHFDWRNALAGGLKPACTGTGAIVAGGYKGDADRSDADAAQHEARSQADQRRSSAMQQRATDANNSIQKVEQFLAEIQQTVNATRLAAATRA